MLLNELKIQRLINDENKQQNKKYKLKNHQKYKF
jgi:hypothetical protein